MQLAHILVQHKYEAEDLLRQLGQGKSFEDLARKYSLCSSAKQGGYLGDLRGRRLDEDFAEAAKLLRPGQVSPIVRTRMGYHLIFRLVAEPSAAKERS